MVSNVSKEFELYEPMRIWFQKYLEEKYIPLEERQQASENAKNI